MDHSVTTPEGARRRDKLPSAPRSAAVVITLRPEAVQRGITYAGALLEVKNRIPATDLDFDMKLRYAATGARIIEIPGTHGSELADGLAGKLKVALADVATVVRAVKRASIRVVELDETVSEADVVAAAATKSGCESTLIRCGKIRPYGRGCGAIHLSLPVTAARKLVEARKLRVGFSVSRVCPLERGPLRCYKCLDVGHTRPVCPSAEDRGALCFRCGLPGHKALHCVANKLHCALCADAGRPAEHYMGGVKCRPPLKKGRMQPELRKPP